MINTSVSAIIPVYNDSKALERAIPVSIETLESITDDFELIIAEDASTDGSKELVQMWEKKDSRIKLIHRDRRLGRGSALSEVISGCRGEIVCYFDVDLATDMNHLSDLIMAIKDGYDMSTGSRLLPESRIVRSGDREVKSRGYNALVRIFLSSKLYDHQCGFKAFNRKKLLEILPLVQDKHWFWDTEVLIRGQKAGFSILEIPVVWNEGPGTTVKTHDILTMGSSIIRLWWQLHVSKN